MTEQTKHPNHEWIVAFAEGKQLQWSAPDWEGWTDFNPKTDDGPWDDLLCKWRVKPESRWYRVALFSDMVSRDWTGVVESESQEAITQSSPAFSRWLTDRVEYEA